MSSDARDRDTAPEWSPPQYAQHAAFVPALGAPLIDLLDPQPDTRILDIGCGDGTLALQIAERGVSVVGIDSSPAFVETARARGVDARLCDAAQLSFDGEFDGAFTNAAMHWMRDHDAVVAGVRRALRGGGRFVGELGGHGNVAAIRVAIAAVAASRGSQIDSPWNFPTADAFDRLLTRHGFSVVRLELFARPTPLPTGMAAWLDTFAANQLGRIAPGDEAATRAEIVELLRPVLCDPDGRWTADYVRLRFVAHAV